MLRFVCKEEEEEEEEESDDINDGQRSHTWVYEKLVTVQVSKYFDCLSIYTQSQK